MHSDVNQVLLLYGYTNDDTEPLVLADCHVIELCRETSVQLMEAASHAWMGMFKATFTLNGSPLYPKAHKKKHAMR